ncbi:hypothetical protein Tco_1209771 [Tanacetum coccineum]
MMSFLTAVVTSGYPTTNNQLRNSSNPRKQATINDGRIMLQPVLKEQNFFCFGYTVKSYTPDKWEANFGKQRLIFATNTKGKAMFKQCTKPKGNGMILLRTKHFGTSSSKWSNSFNERNLAFLFGGGQDPGVAKLKLHDCITHKVMPPSEQSNVVNHSKTEITSDSNIIPYSHVNDTLTAELERYKEQVKVLKEGQNVDLRSNDNASDTITLLKNDFKKEESRNIDREIALEKKIKQLDNIKPQQLEPKLYDGNVIKNTSAIVVPDSKETLILAEESRLKMLLKQKHRMMLEKKINTAPVDYVVLNQLSQDFETRFVPQTELSVEQAFWSQNYVNSLEPILSSRPTIVEVPKELPKVSMVNTSLKKLKHHLAGFDVVVK